MQIRLQDLTALGCLHYLYLQNNSVSALEPGAFLNQEQLLELALNGNLIHLVTADMFRGLEHLRILYLASNQITRIQDHTFRGLQVGREDATYTRVTLARKQIEKCRLLENHLSNYKILL